MNISYIIFIWSCFCPMMIPSFDVFVIISSLGRKRTISFAHVTILAISSCLSSDGLFFNKHSQWPWSGDTTASPHSMHWFPFIIPYRHLIEWRQTSLGSLHAVLLCEDPSPQRDPSVDFFNLGFHSGLWKMRMYSVIFYMYVYIRLVIY